MTAMFSPEEVERYRRHLVLREVGGPGQQRFKAARVLIVGAGGLGSPLLLYLAAAGIGTLGIADDDAVSLSNLQRQVAHGTDAVGVPKTESAAETARRINPHVTVEKLPRITAENAAQLVAAYDVVADGSDNFATRYLLDDACAEAGKPLVYGALGPFDGQVSVFLPDGPRYRDLFPIAPAPGSVPDCRETGILGAVAGVVGTLMSTEVLKLVAGIGEPLAGRLLLWDALAQRFETVSF
jgi:adenylyltransferase/sulfurtransferase